MPDIHVHMGRLLAHTSIGLKAHQMDVETPARGKHILEACTRERGGCFTRDILVGLDLGGSYLHDDFVP